MVPNENDEDNRTYTVVANHEEQYSIWLADLPIPSGWRAVGKTGRKADCLSYVDAVWTDMRPLSLRRAMAEQKKAATRADDGDVSVVTPPPPDAVRASERT
jgi:MbtH protein